MVKLLVADDEQKICRVLGDFFSKQGYQVFLAHDGRAALETIRRERPHLVFLDLRMPGLNGLDILKEAKSVDETIKIIVITAIEDEDIERCQREIAKSKTDLEGIRTNLARAKRTKTIEMETDGH